MKMILNSFYIVFETSKIHYFIRRDIIIKRRLRFRVVELFSVTYQQAIHSNAPKIACRRSFSCRRTISCR